MVTVTCPGEDPALVEPEPGVTLSHAGPPDNRTADADHANEPVPMFSTDELWGGVTPPPCTAVNSNPRCEMAIRCGRGATLMVSGTLIVSPVVPLETLKLAPKVPAGRVAGSTVTTSAWGVPARAIPDRAERPMEAVAAPEGTTLKLRLPLPAFKTRNDCVCSDPLSITEICKVAGCIARSD